MIVDILGSGPSGLIAAWAASSHAEVRIYAANRKSPMHGAQILEKHIPHLGLSEKPDVITSEMNGPLETYRKKVYDVNAWPREDRPEVVRAIEDGDPGKPFTWRIEGWPIRDCYDRLWDLFSNHILTQQIDARWLTEHLDENSPDLCISTIPAQVLCTQGHQFAGQKIWSTTGYYGPAGDPDNHVRFNVFDEPRWYRTAQIHGHSTTEWPDGPRPPLERISHVTKPLHTNCDCFPEVTRMGRFGRWEKEVLAHHAWDQTLELIDAFNRGYHYSATTDTDEARF